MKNLTVLKLFQLGEGINNQGVKKKTFIQTGRRGGDRKSQGREDGWQNGSWHTRWSRICMWISWEEQLRSETDHATQGPSAGK